MKIPVALEDALYAATAAVLPATSLAPSKLARWIVDRSERYTSARDALAKPPDPDGDLAARALFFTPCDAMKIAVPLAELARRGALPAARPLRVVDLGAGCGAMTLGLAAHLGDGVVLDVLAIDRDLRALQIAKRAMAAIAPGSTFAVRAAEVANTPIPTADLVVLGTVLNELPDQAARRALLDRALAAIGPDGAVIVIEPALRETSRDLHALRDAIAASGGHVFAPCTRAGPCPALLDERDWCHEDRPLELPTRTAQLARATGLRDGGMRFSYLVLRRAPGAVADAGAWRVVSAPHVQKGKHEIIGCGDAGRVTIRLLKRNRTNASRVVELARRGDVLVIDAPADADRVEVLATTAVTRHTPGG